MDCCFLRFDELQTVLAFGDSDAPYMFCWTLWAESRMVTTNQHHLFNAHNPCNKIVFRATQALIMAERKFLFFLFVIFVTSLLIVTSNLINCFYQLCSLLEVVHINFHYQIINIKNCLIVFLSRHILLKFIHTTIKSYVRTWRKKSGLRISVFIY
jgi:hypothetical protein